MSSVNKVILLGNVGKDPEIRSFQNGSELAQFSLATTDGYKNKKTGEWVSNTEWHYIKVYNENLVNFVKKFVKKGSKVYVEGQIKTEVFTDAQGKERKSTHILLSKFKGDIKILDKKEEGEKKELAQGSYDNFQDEIPF